MKVLLHHAPKPFHHDICAHHVVFIGPCEWGALHQHLQHAVPGDTQQFTLIVTRFYILYHSSMLKWYRYFIFFLMEYEDEQILYSQCHGS